MVALVFLDTNLINFEGLKLFAEFATFNFPMFDWGEITPTSELSNWNRDSIDSKLKVHFLVVNFPHFDGSTPPFCSTILWRLPVSPASPAATDRRRGGFRRRAKCWRRGGPGVAGTSHSRWIPLMWIKKAKHATDYRIGIMSLIQLDHLVLSTPKIFKIFVRSWSQVWKKQIEPPTRYGRTSSFIRKSAV